MNGIGIITMVALLSATLSKAGDSTATNRIPEPIHQLMNSAGYAFSQIDLSQQNTNSLRQWRSSEPGRLVSFVSPPQKTDWSLWKNSKFKYIGNKTDQPNLLSPSAVLSHYEYNITYSFAF